MATQVTISTPWSEGTLEVVDLNGTDPDEETPSETSGGTWWETESSQTSVVQTSDYASDSSLNSERYRKKRTPVKRRQVEKSLLSDAFPAISVRCHQVNEACEASHLPAQCHVLIAAPRFPTPAPRRPLSEPDVWPIPTTPPVVARSASWEKETRSRPRQRRRVLGLVDSLLLDIYRQRRPSLDSDSGSCALPPRVIHSSRLHLRSVSELRALAGDLETHVEHMSAVLLRQLRRRDALRGRQERHCAVLTAMLQAKSQKRSEDARMRFSVAPSPGDSGFNQWRDAMRMVARLPGGIPPEFRRRLWLTLAERHLQATGVDWSKAHRLCFNEWSNPDDEQLGVQIVKDLHRTGCSLFCGAEAEQNQALLKRVLLAYARWNKAVGYCQGFNMLAALILQVMDRSETDSVKVMIYLVEGVLPESYFANNLRGLSVDMAVFRDLLSRRLPALSRHLERLQLSANDGASGTSYEPPLTNVFTMQWFLTLFSNCLPQPAVLRVWDLIFLEGNEVLLRTALAIWDGLADRILAVNSADEFYSIMGVLTREMLEFGLMDTNNLVKTVVSLAPFPFPELPELRDKYLYNITPWTQSVSTAARRGLKIFYSDDDDEMDEDDEKIAVAAAYGISTVFRSPRRRDSVHREHPPALPTLNYSGNVPDKERLALDISALKQQYAKLRERQRQAHIILTAACTRQTMGPSAPTPVAMNHLLLGKSALLNVRGRRVGPPAGAVPPPVNNKNFRKDAKDQLVIPKGKGRNQQISAKAQGETLHWKDAVGHKKRKDEETSSTENETAKVLSSGSSGSSSSSTSTELCDEPDRLSDFDSEEATSLSDASSYIPSKSPHLPSGTSPAAPEGPTLMSVSPIKELPVQEVDHTVPSIRLDTAEDRVSESSSGYSVSFGDQKSPLEDSGADADLPLIEPISAFVALEQMSPDVRSPQTHLPSVQDIPFRDIDIASCDNSLSPVISQTNKTEPPNAEEVTGTSEYDADMSAIMEINQRLHGIHDRSQEGSGQQDEDVAEVMNDLLSLDQRMSSGRRNSERALKIIQENSEILQRILKCQNRRLSEESSNNVSEEDSVPSSTSAENVTFDVASATRSQDAEVESNSPKSPEERTNSYYRGHSKETIPGEVSPFFSTSRYSHLSGIGTVSEGSINIPEKSEKSRTPSPEVSGRLDYTRDQALVGSSPFSKDVSSFPMTGLTSYISDDDKYLRSNRVSDLTDDSSLSLNNYSSKFIALKLPELEPPSKQRDFVTEFPPNDDLVPLTEKFSTERFISEYSTHGSLLSERNVKEGKTSSEIESESSKQSRISKFSEVDDLISGRVDLETPANRFDCEESVGESRGDETSLYGSGSRFEEFFHFDTTESREPEMEDRTLPHITQSDSKSDFSHGSRPPSPTVTEMLNRSPSPPRSPLFRYTASPSRGRERPASLFLAQDSPSFELLDHAAHKGRLSPLYKSLSLLSVNDDKQKPKKKDKSPMRRRTSTDLTTFSFSKIKSPVAISPVKSPSRQRDLGLYPQVKQQGSPSKSPLHFNPFPYRTSTWQPKELGIKLGLYSSDETSKARKS